MGLQEIADLHPEVAEAFLGKAGLESALSHFESREGLLAAYADVQTRMFGEETTRDNKCDLCEHESRVVGWIEVEWETRLAWRLWRLLWVIPAVAVLVLLKVMHLTFLFRSQLENTRIEIAEVISFTTRYSVYKTCKRRLSIREILRLSVMVLGLMAVLILGVGAIVSGATLGFALWNGLKPPGSMWVSVAEIGCAVVVVILLLTVGRRWAQRKLVPWAIRRMVKDPFGAVAFEMHKVRRD